MAEAETTKLRCTRCDAKYDLNLKAPLCPRCRAPLMVEYDYDSIRERLSRDILNKRLAGTWKYSELLPLHKENVVISLGEGGTFLHDCKRLAKELGVKRLLVKDETTNPTGSFIDRGMTVAVSMVKMNEYSKVMCGLAGNLGASLAAYAAKAGLGCTVFVSPTIDLGKLYQMIAFGAEVKHARDEADVPKASNLDGYTFRLEPIDPFLLQGEKTTGYEIMEQMGWRPPDRIIVPMGNGTHISMTWMGIRELQRVGLLLEVGVRMTGVQVAGASPIVNAFTKTRSKAESSSSSEIPMDISFKEPLLEDLAIRSMRDSGGDAVAVSEKEIIDAVRVLARMEGIFAEPAAASTIAAIRRLVEDKVMDRDEEVVCVITGTGLKDPVAARRMVRHVRNIEVMIRKREERGLTTELGLTKIRILHILARGDSYGYSVWKQLSARFGLSVQMPSVYQHLNELESLRLVQRTRVVMTGHRPERSYYSITSKGRQILSSLRELAA